MYHTQEHSIPKLKVSDFLHPTFFNMSFTFNVHLHDDVTPFCLVCLIVTGQTVDRQTNQQKDGHLADRYIPQTLLIWGNVRLAPVLKTIFHQCVISYTCSQSYSDGSVLKQSHQSKTGVTH